MKEIKADGTERLPVLTLLARAMTGFICILTEMIPAGLLPSISAGLNISPSIAGQMVSAYAAGSLLAAIILYTYLAPFLYQSGLSSSVDVVLLVFGLSAMVGIFMTGKMVGSGLGIAVLLSLSVFTLVSIIFGISSTSLVVIYLGIAAWGLTFGGAATLLQTALADTAGEHVDIVLSMNVVTWNSAIALGGLIGGLLLRHEGASSLPWALVTLLIVVLIIGFRAKSHEFPAGSRPS